MLKRALAAATAAISLTGMQAPQFPVLVSPQRDWGATLRIDAQALHDDLAANHPGSVNADDPGFARQNEAQLRLALRRARSARTYADHFHALAAYAAAFNDGHLGFGAIGSTPSGTRWPGFLTAYGADGKQRVGTRADDGPLPLGARLVGCDGRSAEQVLEETVGRFIGRWALRSQRMRWGGTLFGDEGNPYVRRPARCTFEIAGRNREITLNWRPIPVSELARRFDSLMSRPRREFGARTLGDGTRWITLGSFDADPQSPSGRALPPLIASLRSGRDALANAPAIVLDLRTNTGGSSDWSRQIAEAIWGRSALARLPQDNSRVDWRVSEANLASLRESRDREIEGGALSPAMRRWFDLVTTGLAEALARGERGLWREPLDEEEPASVREAPDQPAFTGPVYALTDAGCASACLDAVDLWRVLGAIHVGQTTSADTLYMDIRAVRLPSGLVGISVPRKVYRGRSRGSNEPVVPVFAFTGNIADTAALERWIAGLRLRRR